MRVAWLELLRVVPVALVAPGFVAAGLGPSAAAAAELTLPQVLGPVAINAASATSDPELRVLLQQDQEIQIEASAQPLLLRGADGSRLGTLEPGQPVRLGLDGSSPTGLLLSWPAGQPMVVSELWLEPAAPEALITLQQRLFRGRLRVLRQGDKLLAINHVALEAYLPSVVGSEMPPSWPQSALRAQAVAARTYALRQRRSQEPFDLRATVASQVYKGVGGETPSTREAVEATRGQVLTYQGALIEAVFHSSSGGSTEASGELWAQQLPYLVPVPDFDEHSPVRSWQERFDASQLRERFPETGGLWTLQVTSRSSSGRVRQLRLEGPRGVLNLSGAELRQRLALRSTWIELELLLPAPSAAAPAALKSPDGALAGSLEPPMPPPLLPPSAMPLLLQSAASAAELPLAALLIRGRGFGHGIGMSQWGAHGLAQRGASYTAILRHYYPGTQINAYRDP
ncbi:MAG: SpoIID/LytB domain-containing protein [Cyanobacteria bacterium K_DeepCast_35m_m2_155]|nr:SpoIID/LytB domain-containing protein [Cyanobacteria bacterium K_DeepCast_35m_m2_155]